MGETVPPKNEDVALVYAPTEDRQGARILRARRGSIEAGEVRPVKDGQPILGREVVTLKPRPDSPALCDVEVVQPAEQATPGRPGPAQVATDEYRENWERIFSKPGRALN
jgi:hypothetical protein